MNKNISWIFEEEEDNKKYEEESTVVTTPAPVNSNISWIFEDDPVTTPDTDDISFERKFDYGIAQEQTVLGNLWQNGVASLRAFMDDGLSFEDALKQVEKERQEELFKEFPEFRDRPEDAAVISGRIAQAFVDPVTWLIPWTKIAKAGKLATTATGSGVAAADVALREKTLYGSVDPTSLLLATVIGGGTSYGSHLLSDKLRKIGAADDAEPSVSVSRKNKEPDPELTEPVVKVINEEGRNAYDELLKNLNSLDFDPTLQKKVLKAVDTMRRNRELGVHSNVLRNKKLKLGPKKLKELGLPTTKKGLREFAKQRAKETLEARRVLSGSGPDLVKLATASITNDINAMVKVGTRVNWDDGIMRKLMYESTRPLFGVAGGAIAGTFMGDNEDDVLLYSMMGLGLAFGLYARAIDRHKFMTNAQKKLLKGPLTEQARMTTTTAIKILSAGTHAARLDAFGGGSALFSRLMYKAQGGTSTTKATTGVESRARGIASQLKVIVGTDVLKDIPEEMLEDIGKLRNGFISLDSLSAKYSPEDLLNIQQASKNIKDFQDSFGRMVSDVGIDFKLLEKYGLTQLWNLEKIFKNQESQDAFQKLVHKAWAVQKFKTTDPLKLDTKIKQFNAKRKDPNAFRDEANEVYMGLTQQRAASTTSAKGHRYASQGSSTITSKGEVSIPLLRNFEKNRVIVDQDARLILQDFIVNDPRQTLTALIDNTVPSMEFARTFGPKGELLKSIRKQIREKYNPERIGKGTTDLEQKEIDQIAKSVDAFFGLHHAHRRWGDVGTATASIFTALANSTMLTRVIIPSTGDLIQPFQNSGIRATLKGYAQMISNGETFAKTGVGIKYNNQLEADLKQLSFNPHPSQKVSRAASWWNDKFFKIVGLKRLTEFARERAYDAGVNRAYDLARRASKGRKINAEELDQLGLDYNDLTKIAKFRGVREAYFDNPETKRILHRAGFMAMERDALIPTVGNRHLFGQSHDPSVRALGQFLSWAQAKTTQTNSLVSRIEDGDGKLAVRMLGALTIYAGVRDFQKMMSPTDYYDQPENQVNQFSLRWLAEGGRLSGNVLPFYTDKLLNAISGPGASDPVTGGVPSLSLFTDIFKLFTTELPPNVRAGDWEGAGVDTLKVLPFGKDLNHWVLQLEDEPNINKNKGLTPFNLDYERNKRYEGGLEVDVPYTKDKPEERINPYTGEPYTAIYKRRTAFGAGGIASILRGIWKAPTQDFTSAATSISQTPAGFKKIKALDGWQAGTKNLDIGGGASFKGVHKHTDALKEEGVENVVFDPFNRTPEENALAVERLGFGQADTATAHNVLNVIPDEGAQLQVIQQMENALKPGGRGYITVYKGAGTGKGKQSRSDSFQQNKKTEEYLPLIRKVFPNAERKGDLIYFSKTNFKELPISPERIAIKEKIEKIPLKERLEILSDEYIPKKYKFLDSDKIDFYEDIVDFNKIPSNFKSNDNTLLRAYLVKLDMPEKFEFDALGEFRGVTHFKELESGKIKIFVPNNRYGGQNKFTTKTFNNPSKKEIEDFLNNMKPRP